MNGRDAKTVYSVNVFLTRRGQSFTLMAMDDSCQSSFLEGTEINTPSPSILRNVSPSVLRNRPPPSPPVFRSACLQECLLHPSSPSKVSSQLLNAFRLATIRKRLIHSRCAPTVQNVTQTPSLLFAVLIRSGVAASSTHFDCQ